MNRDTFVFYKDWKEAIKDLPDDIRLEIYESIIEYATTGSIKGLKPMANIAFNFMKTTIDRDVQSYADKCKKNKENGMKGAEYGKIGGRPRIQEKPRKTPNGDMKTPKNPEKPIDNDNENDNDFKKKSNKKEKIDFSFVDSTFLSIFQEWIEYKKSKGQSYKNQKSLMTCYSHLIELSNGNQGAADKIIKQSIANNWSGLFELKTSLQIQNNKKNVSDSVFEHNRKAVENGLKKLQEMRERENQ